MKSQNPIRAGWWLPLLGPLTLAGCGTSGDPRGKSICDEDINTGTVRPDYWTKVSHCPGVSGNYAEVFDGAIVRTMNVNIDSSDYQSMQADLEAKYKNVNAPDFDAVLNPIYVPATLAYDGMIWKHVGMRWKGNASLAGAVTNGLKKLSFTLNFDEFETTNPELLDQRFFGFEKLSFCNAYNDPSRIRDKIAGDIFRDAQIPMARSSFVAVYIDVSDGAGPVYYGLYTMLEAPEDEFLKAQLGSTGVVGNLYKPWGNAARWQSLSEVAEPQLATEFSKETNALTSDWTDVIKAINALHADRTNAATWRANLESVFDVNSFLKTFAVNQVMVNWDVYGCKHHNYMVYADPNNGGKLRWLPWDLNESLALNTKDPDCFDPGSVMLDEIVIADLADTTTTFDAKWPLIRYILGDATYRATYVGFVKEVLGGAFAADKVETDMRAAHALVAPYIVGPIAKEVGPYWTEPASDFAGALESNRIDPLIPHVKARHTAVNEQIAGL